MNRVEVIEEGPDGLARVRWVFWADPRHDGLRVHVDVWADEHRKTKRHKWSPSKIWSRLSLDRNWGRSTIAAQHPPLPDHVREQARAQIVESITFVEST